MFGDELMYFVVETVDEEVYLTCVSKEEYLKDSFKMTSVCSNGEKVAYFSEDRNDCENYMKNSDQPIVSRYNPDLYYPTGYLKDMSRFNGYMSGVLLGTNRRGQMVICNPKNIVIDN